MDLLSRVRQFWLLNLSVEVPEVELSSHFNIFLFLSNTSHFPHFSQTKALPSVPLVTAVRISDHAKSQALEQSPPVQDQCIFGTRRLTGLNQCGRRPLYLYLPSLRLEGLWEIIFVIQRQNRKRFLNVEPSNARFEPMPSCRRQREGYFPLGYVVVKG